jgi:hypothetical protein
MQLLFHQNLERFQDFSRKISFSTCLNIILNNLKRVKVLRNIFEFTDERADLQGHNLFFCVNSKLLMGGLGGLRPPSGGVAGGGPRREGSAQRSARVGGDFPLLY